MKIKMGIKALILGAVLFAEAAHAQSSVQLYGLLDAFVGYKKPMNGQSSVIAVNFILKGIGSSVAGIGQRDPPPVYQTG